ncbi:hypothetical protein E2562_000948 [Oryza meyeriana var. granulata]|uniref:Uncharacterized protein n=1 Tax=Oryza meyeriana var. granulata TaxID=110450 RepID=A0A6G1CYE3_9ORYZ|nr:hypothetical protein E2562_000948 [Oryza meyeriana var. granulata]
MDRRSDAVPRRGYKGRGIASPLLVFHLRSTPPKPSLVDPRTASIQPSPRLCRHHRHLHLEPTRRRLPLLELPCSIAATGESPATTALFPSHPGPLPLPQPRLPEPSVQLALSLPAP